MVLVLALQFAQFFFYAYQAILVAAEDWRYGLDMVYRDEGFWRGRGGKLRR